MSLLEELVSTDLVSQSLSRAQFFRAPPSLFPDSIHLLANWAITNDDTVFIGPPASDLETTEINPVPFGDIHMYPWYFRKDSGGSDYVQIIPAIDQKGPVTKTGLIPARRTFCYAVEIILARKNTSGDTFDHYAGDGAFTMAYNTKGETTGVYSNTAGMPTPIKVSQSNGQAVYTKNIFLTATLKTVLKASLTTPEIFRLEILLRSGPDDVGYPVYAYDFEVLNRTDFQKSQASGGIGGIIKKPSSTVYSKSDLSFTMSDLQIIFPSEENKGLQISTASMAFSPEIQKRNDFILNYAFDPSLMKALILTPARVYTYAHGTNYYDYKNLVNRDDPNLPGTSYILAVRGGNVKGANQVRVTNRKWLKTTYIFPSVSFDIKSTVKIVRRPTGGGTYKFFIEGKTTIQFVKSNAMFEKTLYTKGSNINAVSLPINWFYDETTTTTSNGLSYLKSINLRGYGQANQTYNLWDLMTPADLGKLETHFTALHDMATIWGIGNQTLTKFTLNKDTILQEMDDFIAAERTRLTNELSSFGLIFSYVMFRPSGNIQQGDVTVSIDPRVQYSEILLVGGYSSASRANLIAGFLNQSGTGGVIAQARLLFNNIKNAYTVGAICPAAVYCRQTSDETLVSWYKSPKLISGNNIGVSIFNGNFALIGGEGEGSI